MKKHILKLTALLLCLCMLSLSLCGCGILERFGIELPDLPFLQDSQKADLPVVTENNTPNQYLLTGPTDFYTEPDFDSQILATYYEGHSVVYHAVVNIDGVQWASSNDGWFVLSGSKPDTQVYTEINKNIILTHPVDVFTEPSLDAAITSRLEAGKKVHLSQLATASANPWALCDYGWILMDDCYFELDNLNVPVAYGVIRDSDACFYPEPNIYSGVVGTPACGSRYGLLAVVEVGGLNWAYTTEGWMPTDSIYEEGTTGFRPCSAIVIDPTPLNVRLAPGTDKEILSTLTYGDRVQILERINYNGSDWGFTGTGWIFMDLTEIQ